MAVQSDHLSPFECGVVYAEERAVITVRGELDIASVPILQREIGATIGLPIVGLTLDLGDLDFLDSSGVQALLGARNDALERNIGFELVSVPGHVRRIIAVTGLIEVFGLDEPGSGCRRVATQRPEA